MQYRNGKQLRLLNMVLLRSLPKFFRSLEWIFLIAHLGMMLSAPKHNIPAIIVSCSLLFLMSWIFPLHAAYRQRLGYIGLGAITVLGAGTFGVNLGLFLQIYASKTYFLLGKKAAIAFICLTVIPWTINEFARESSQFGTIDPIRLGSFTIAAYTAASFFTLTLSQMIVSQQKSDQKIEELSEQVESLAARLERTRIAREIHDSLGHTLTDLDTQLAVAQTLRSHNPNQAFQAVDTAKQLARQCLEDVSHALSRMRESDFDLNQSLATLLEQLRHTTPLKVDWKVNLPNLSVYQSHQIYCLVKEAMMNVQKHAKASYVQLSAQQTPEGIILDIVDDGIGFNAKAFKPGFGLQGMMERVQLLGGQFDLQTDINQGTRIHITLPL
jgi:signal transduction histidine kinase